MTQDSFGAFYGIHQFTCCSCKKPSQMPLLVYLRWFAYYDNDMVQCTDCALENAAKEFSEWKELTSL